MKVWRILATKGTKVITVQPDNNIKKAIMIMAQHHIGAAVVTDDTGKPIGILSERDIINYAAQHQDLFTQSVSALMTHDLITGTPQDDTFSIAHTMTEKRFRHLPIVEEGELVGIISIGDILKAERDQYRGEIDTLETQIMADE